jgi:hypothetical protein
MSKKGALLGDAWSRVSQNKRYIICVYFLNLWLAVFGGAAFYIQAHDFLDHSLLADRLVHGLDLAVLIEMLVQPNFGSVHGAFGSSLHFAMAFFFLAALFIPGVLMGYASTYRLPREDFFRACGRNLWRFIRLMIVAGIVMGAAAGALFGARSVLMKKAAESTNELLPFYVSVAALCLIFLVMTALRIWFDLAQTDLVLSDQRIVRKSIATGFRHLWRSLGQLLGAYTLIAIVGVAILFGGILVWLKFVPPASVLSATLVGQLTLLFLLIPRFWQRGVAVTYYLQNMVEPITERSFAPEAIARAAAIEPIPPVNLNPPPEPAGS